MRNNYIIKIHISKNILNISAYFERHTHTQSHTHICTHSISQSKRRNSIFGRMNYPRKTYEHVVVPGTQFINVEDEDEGVGEDANGEEEVKIK